MNKDSHSGISIGNQEKIGATHLERLAYIYVRQSTPKQVANNQESQMYQRRLASRAKTMGWHKERIRIIDADQAQSGRESSYREGFQKLVSEVSLAHVGIIFGYEVSRLARNNRDWYHLLDLAAVFDTLIADNDGIYNLRFYNDRLLLGLKGTMSEAELHLLKGRLAAGRMNQVYRGAYRQHLPTGLVRLADGSVVKDPDEQVRHVIKMMFIKFEELGSCHQVLRYFRRENILLPRHQTSGFHAGETIWKVASAAAIYDMLRNPAYSGAFVYGRKQIDPTRRRPGQPTSARIRRPMNEWLHIQKDVYPAYITWEQFLANQEQMRQNATLFAEKKLKAQGAARKGNALLQGLAICGCCGHRLYVCYKSTHRYACHGLDRAAKAKACMSLHGLSIDTVVERTFFEAIRPSQLDALDAILAEQQTERTRLLQQWQQRLKRAQYEVHLAERQYNAVDPDNRLVAGELERRWEDKLRQLRETGEAFDHFQQTPAPSSIPADLRQQFQYLSQRLPDLWPRLATDQKKELLRSLIAKIILKRVSADKIEVKIIWVSGQYTIVYACPPIHRQKDTTGYDEIVKLIHLYWQEGLTDKKVAAQLTAKGFHSARLSEIRPYPVMKIRLANGWFITPERRYNVVALEGYLTIRGLAARLDIKRWIIYRWIRSGVIDPKYVLRNHQNTYMIRDKSELIEELKQQIAKKKRSS